MTQVPDYSNTTLPPTWARWLMTPIGGPTLLLSAIDCLGLLWTARLPSPDFFTPVVLIQVCVTILLALWVFLRFALCVTLRLIYRSQNGRAMGWRFAAPLAMGAIVALLIYCEIPQWTAWWISRPALQRMADEIIAKNATATGTAPIRYPPRWVGLYQLSEVNYLPWNHAVQVYPKGTGTGVIGLDRVGFAFFPGGTPVPVLMGEAEGATYSPWEGNWFRAREVW